MKNILIIILFLLTISQLQARPISYANGWTIMTKNDFFQNILHIHYSPNVKNSIGGIYINMREDNMELAGLQWNQLLFRRNSLASQANVYLMTQAGGTINNDSQLFGNVAIAGDWETRRYFTSYWAGTFYANDLNDGEFSQKARVGIAPYLSNYGGFHTWIMFQVDHRPEREDKIVLTPLLRFFKGPYMAEVGVNDNGDFLFNAIIRL